MSNVVRVSEFKIDIPSKRYVNVVIEQSMVGKMADADTMDSLLGIASVLYFSGSVKPANFGEEVVEPNVSLLEEVFETLLERFANSHWSFRDTYIGDILDNIDEAPAFWNYKVVPYMVDFFEEMNEAFGFPRKRNASQAGNDDDDRVAIFVKFMTALENSVVCEYFP